MVVLSSQWDVINTRNQEAQVIPTSGNLLGYPRSHHRKATFSSSLKGLHEAQLVPRPEIARKLWSQQIEKVRDS